MALNLDKIRQKVAEAPKPTAAPTGPTLGDYNAAVARADDLARKLAEETRLRISSTQDLARAEAEIERLKKAQTSTPPEDHVVLSSTDHAELLTKINDLTRARDEASARVQEIQAATQSPDDDAAPQGTESDSASTVQGVGETIEKLKDAQRAASPETALSPEQQAAIEKQLDNFIDTYSKAIKLMMHKHVPAAIKRELAILTKGMAQTLGELEQLLIPTSTSE